MGWVIVAVVVLVLVEIAGWKEVLSGKAATWRFYLWTLFTLYAGVCALYGYGEGWRSRSANSNEEITFAAVMLILGALVAFFIDRIGVKAARIIKDIIEANRRA